MTSISRNKNLINLAFKALKNSYSPYSKFKVGAALLTNKGSVYTGTNVEFDAFTLTVCAERSAIFNAVSNGEKKFIKLVIATNKQDFKFPCGLCRQALAEFNPNLEIILVNREKKKKRVFLNNLLPQFFKLK